MAPAATHPVTCVSWETREALAWLQMKESLDLASASRQLCLLLAKASRRTHLVVQGEQNCTESAVKVHGNRVCQAEAEYSCGDAAPWDSGHGSI